MCYEAAMTSPIEDAILSLLADLPPGKSIDPANVAKIILPERWQRALGQVRSTAVGMARIGQVVILRHNKPADPDTFKGVYRLRMPMEGDVIVASAPEVDGEEA
jgi:hypothetical protein